MKLSLFTSAALLVLTAPFAIVKAASLRAVSVQDSNDNNAVRLRVCDSSRTHSTPATLSRRKLTSRSVADFKRGSSSSPW
eukprot:CAMPEP_0178815400 /NCGR_PEP_ID=MMETSP0746-20121128/801_1 /TAXON_ID=913974 /ORGANISM="Nitzschia punctata, Strain CCMP561" /LENGTH=79 /DNA_ID=CAMNT_0020476361 /DNA_START=772 /DNA_END=1008 /DNA_ORIENTATION=-